MHETRHAGSALRKIARRLSEITSVSVPAILSAKRGNQKASAMRALAIEFARTRLRFSRMQVALALPSEKRSKKNRHPSTISAACLRAAELRERAEVADLMDFIERHLHDAAPPPGSAKRARAFTRAWEEAAKIEGARISLRSMQAAFAAAADAHPLAPSAQTAPKRAQRTATPVFDDEPEAVALMRRAPAFRAAAISWERVGDGVFITLVAKGVRDRAAELLRRATRWVEDGGFGSAEQRTLQAAPGGWRLVLKAGVAAMLGFAVLGHAGPGVGHFPLAGEAARA